MQKIATKVFIIASLTFGISGIYMVLTGTDPGDGEYGFDLFVSKIFICSVFVILTSGAISVAGKYLKDKS